MPKPTLDLVPEFYQGYIKGIEEEELIPALINHGNITLDLLKSIPEVSAGYCYQPGKWSIKQVVAHMIDTERIFAYRSLAIARNDKTPLPGFEENDYAEEANVENRKLYRIIEEYNNVRASTIDLFSSFSETMLHRENMCNGNLMSVNTIGYIIVGHEAHHRAVLLERYLSN
ncbi:DinB family protein [Fulvivirga sediminis]|uniref:DinB family protein n=1 Tax=Fulvivirga sediminis TaxID=2803949 RepID=A0A937F7L9_9BACT|nr:DinB family protein [Fulvivirga sediminis]MBL3657831.1 DinB family protein [Fulvivirga sediminis]